MPDGGRLTIQTANRTVGDDEAARRGVKPGAYVMIEVADTGVGIDAEMRAHLFEPFFTTKDHGKGTGLGLSTVYGIVSQSGGHVQVDSDRGKGTTFRVFLPRVDAEPAPTNGDATRHRPAPVLPAPSGEPPRPPRETVLLVEDAERVRAVVREILETQDYHVLEARRGDEAIERAAAHAGPIHLLLTDVVMPEMSGRELAQHLLRDRPDVKVLYMSGYTDDAIVRHGVRGSGIAFIAKPFTPDALADKVREILDEVRR
jgi:CheY-like chemotaxis protein